MAIAMLVMMIWRTIIFQTSPRSQFSRNYLLNNLKLCASCVLSHFSFWHLTIEKNSKLQSLHILSRRCKYHITYHITIHRYTYPITQVYISYYTDVHILLQRCTIHLHILLHRCTYPISQVYISYYTNVHILLHNVRSQLGTHDEALVGRSFTWPRLHDKHLQDVTTLRDTRLRDKHVREIHLNDKSIKIMTEQNHDTH